ncbi:GATA transcription factor 8-like [Dorcoceras hygrometricum]|uniref:GATA transcription factor n=1 Tax=Dorcoceras hygrometricum TaxID=472368 RepID=A0A2Z7AYA4_9LAMI|nr:GATA transcription factor 8-like [Dorcoceras hygrometricum]
MDSNFMDEIDCTAFFEQIDDFIEFPPENESGGVSLGTSSDSKDIPSTWDGALPEKTDRLLPGIRDTASSDLSPELFVPYEDIVQLEWLSTFVEESFSGGGGSTIGKVVSCIDTGPSHDHFQSPSPVSILDSNSNSSTSFSVEETTPSDTNHHGTQRARTKRPRPRTSNARAAIQPISPASSTELPPTKKVLKPVGLELYRKKKTIPPVKKCLHCDMTKTPQWRAGPMGPKTLCNACGVRHKSGRLFPEYRPAASPTFLSSLHSNSHKKVMEMRSNIFA